MRAVLLAAIAALVTAQNAPIPVTTQTLSTSAARWLLQLDSPWSERSLAIGQMLAPTMRQAATYYHTMHPNKGVRVGQVNLLQQADLRRALCSGAQLTDCPSLIYYYGGRAQVYRGSGSLEDVVGFVERQAAATASLGQQQQQTRAQAQAAAAAALRSSGAAGVAGAASTRGAWPPPSPPAGSGKAALEQWLRQQQGGGGGKQQRCPAGTATRSTTRARA